MTTQRSEAARLRVDAAKMRVAAEKTENAKKNGNGTERSEPVKTTLAAATAAVAAENTVDDSVPRQAFDIVVSKMHAMTQAYDDAVARVARERQLRVVAHTRLQEVIVHCEAYEDAHTVRSFARQKSVRLLIETLIVDCADDSQADNETTTATATATMATTTTATTVTQAAASCELIAGQDVVNALSCAGVEWHLNRSHTHTGTHARKTAQKNDGDESSDEYSDDDSDSDDGENDDDDDDEDIVDGTDKDSTGCVLVTLAHMRSCALTGAATVPSLTLPLFERMRLRLLAARRHARAVGLVTLAAVCHCSPTLTLIPSFYGSLPYQVGLVTLAAVCHCSPTLTFIPSFYCSLPSHVGSVTLAAVCQLLLAYAIKHSRFFLFFILLLFS
jgi:hypothetical protein